MSVEYPILIVDHEAYREWVMSLDEMDEEQRAAAQGARGAFVVEVNDRLYPAELHNSVAQVADEIIEALEQGRDVEVEKPVSSFLGRLMGKKEMVVERQPITDRSLTAFADFARVIYWSQVGGRMGNELAVIYDHLELTLSSAGVGRIVTDLEAFDAPALEAYCEGRGGDLSMLREVLPGGLVALKEGWLSIARECIEKERFLVIEVY